VHDCNGPYEFHVSREARDRCRFDEALFASSGRVVLAHPAAAHRFAAAFDATRPGAPRSSAADLFALGLLDEAAHVVFHRWRESQDPGALRDILGALREERGAAAVERLLLGFVERFPPLEVYRGERTALAWVAGSTQGRPHDEVALEELMLLWLVNANPAAEAYRELFDDTGLAGGTDYRAAMRVVEAQLALRPPVGASGLGILEFLRAPVRAAPRSLAGQLEFVSREWAGFLGDLITRMRLAFDLRAEEARWLASREALARGEGHGTGIVEPPDYTGSDPEDERFSPDAEWMPRTVMIAKSTLVWLDQLARKHARDISRLDQVPDEELDRLAAFGVNALWLIGLWERSAASRTIKQAAGQPDAAASAYAVHDYVVAHELGGEDAWRNLSERAGRRGIRLASDMVPNHMGLDSRWVIEHPEWFLSRPDLPYPAYSFHGHELSSDARVSIRIEDHYWDRSDAAVVFQRHDRETGDTRFIYHGNDGTSFPWNDTAQLDYLNPAAREAVIQAILGVARRFPIIRFDAAMTLAKRHIQRLWFPEPGSGGAIPSRAGHGCTRAQFDRLMPKEFWREVVDRVAREAPGTLLLAEAFWMMEGYFVRTLGMHRVYNSAFMVMLRDERNSDYRTVLRNTLEFDPDILQRWVNFMNNPDERTAVDQFGRGEKYFGVCTLLATLPGLPMFGHGQVEGFEERYGMEFRRAMRDEPVDEGLEREHWRRIVPLLHRRSMFAGAREFLLYDCRDGSGHVNEDVFAYSNRDASGAGLVLFHNRHAEAHGRIRWSAAYSDKTQPGRGLRKRPLVEGLGLDHVAHDALVRCRELVSGHEHLLRASELRDHGLRVDLGEFGSRVFLDWREVARDARPWDELARRLGGGGVPDLEDALWAIALEPAHAAFAGAFAPTAEDASLRRDAALAAHDALLREARALLSLAPAAPATPIASSTPSARARFSERFDHLETLVAGSTKAETTPAEQAAHLAWLLLESCGFAIAPAAPRDAGLRLFDELRLREPLGRALHAHGAEGDHAWRLAARVRALLAHAAAGGDAAGDADRRAFLADPDARFAAAIAEDTPAAKLPEWLALPSRFEARSLPKR
jgi:glycosidase